MRPSTSPTPISTSPSSNHHTSPLQTPTTSETPQVLIYQHRDRILHAEVQYFSEDLTWIISYYRQGHFMGNALYQSQATAELLLCSLGYRRLDVNSTTA